MLQLDIPGGTLFDESRQQFIEIKGTTIQLEHSLVSISKWESKWHKPFLGTEEKTWEESIDYIRCMTITQNVNPAVYLNIDDKNVQKVYDYINDPMTATWFKDNNRKGNQGVVTAEIVYYWMIALEIPFECQRWHFNKLLTLIRVCNEKNNPKKKMSANDVRARNRSINQARKAKHHTHG